MKRTSIRRAIVPGAAALALTLTACGAANETDAAANGESDLSGTLAGGGASTQQAAMSAWSVGFQEMHPDVTVEYDPIGSGGGRENFINGAFPFAGTDTYLTDEEGELSAATERCGGEPPIQVPSYISPIAIAYNLPGVDQLNLSPEALAGVFSGQITQWDAPAIAQDNPDVDLPSERINVVHRSDESGTTENFTNYLTTVAEDVWTAGVVENWPSEYGGEGAKGTSGVVQTVENADYSIGYADASQTDELGVARIGVGDQFVEPSAEAAAKILEVSPKAEVASENAMVYDLDYTTEEGGTYPIVLTSYLVACTQYDDSQTGELVKAFMSYVTSEEGQQQAADEAGSAPLSPALREQAQGIIDGIGR